MARAHFVKRARTPDKARKAAGIKKGDSYWWWAFMVGGRGGPKHYSLKPPKPSQLTQSEFLGAFLALEEDIGALVADDGLGDAVSEIAGRYHELGDEQEEKKNNMPDGLQDGDTGNMLEERANKCNEIADELEGLTFDLSEKEKDQSDEDFWESKLEEVNGVDLSAP